MKKHLPILAIYLLGFSSFQSIQAKETLFFPGMKFIKVALLKSQIKLPITWNDSSTVDYSTIDFGGNLSIISSDPANASNLVLKIMKTSAAETWAGTTLGTSAGFAAPVPFSTGNTSMRARVFSPASGMQIRMKVEDSNDPTKTVETIAMTTATSGWQILTFDFANQAPGTAVLNMSQSYNKLSMFFNFGIDGATAGPKTFYLDDVEFGAGPAPTKAKINLPITWNDTATVDYATTDFAGDLSSLAGDPLNPNNIVLKINRSEVSLEYAGTTLGTDFGLANAIPLTEFNHLLSARVYTPAAGTRVRLKIENIAGGGVNVETDQYTSVANQWEDLTFDFSQNATGTPAINYSNIYNKVVIFFDFGSTGATIGPKTYYLDDVIFGTFTSVAPMKESKGMTVFPNPSNGTFMIPVENSRSGLVRVEIIDQLGRSIPSVISTVNDGLIKLELPKASKGLYVCKIHSEGESRLATVSVQ
jgi:Secretion system C-terminal sorting domain